MTRIRPERLKQGTASNGQVLTYNSATDRWVGAAPSVPTLDQVLAVGNTTTASLTVGALNVNGNITVAAGRYVDSPRYLINGAGGLSGYVLAANGGSNAYWFDLPSALAGKASNNYVNDTFATNTYVNSTFANSTQLALKANLSSPTFTGTVTLPAVSANGSTGTAGQVLTSNGTGTYWATATSTSTLDQVLAAGSVSGRDLTANVITATSQLAAPSISSSIIVASPIIRGGRYETSGGNVGLAGQVLTSNGNGNSYWSTPNTGGFTNGQSISVANLVVGGSFTANGSTGTAGQVLTSNGSATYWSVAANADAAYTNAIAYAASNTYVNTQLALKANLASPTFTGTVTLPAVSANGLVGSSGQYLSSNGSGVYWADLSTLGLISATSPTFSGTSTFSGNSIFTGNTVFAGRVLNNIDNLGSGNFLSLTGNWSNYIRYNWNTGNGTLNLGSVSGASGRHFMFILELTCTVTGTFTWPSSIRWARGIAPSIENGTVNLILLSTVDSGFSWRGSYTALNNS